MPALVDACAAADAFDFVDACDLGEEGGRGVLAADAVADLESERGVGRGRERRHLPGRCDRTRDLRLHAHPAERAHVHVPDHASGRRSHARHVRVRAVFTGAGENRWETGLAHTPGPASREFRSVRPKLLWRKMLHTGLFLNSFGRSWFEKATLRGRMWPSSGLRSSWPPFGNVSRRRTCSRSPAVAATWSTSPSSRRKDRLRRSLPAKRSLASDSFSRDSLWRSSSLHCDHAPIAYEAERRLRECSRMSLDGSL